MIRSKISVCFAILIGLSVMVPGRTHAADAELTFVPSTITTKTNGTFTVSVVVDTGGFESGGVGVIINFDSQALAAETIKTGSIFADYPLSAIDNERGKIAISGVAASADHLFNGRDDFADITFKAKIPVTTAVTFTFVPGSTIDSNIAVTTGNGDVLSKVDKLVISIDGAAAYTDTSSAPKFSVGRVKENWQILLANLRLPFLRDKYAAARSGRTIAMNIDPLEPITAQPPITDASAIQPSAAVYNVAAETTKIVELSLIAVIALAAFGTVFVIYRRGSA